MSKKRVLGRCLSALLSVMMVITSVPMDAYAAPKQTKYEAELLRTEEVTTLETETSEESAEGEKPSDVTETESSVEETLSETESESTEESGEDTTVETSEETAEGESVSEDLTQETVSEVETETTTVMDMQAELSASETTETFEVSRIQWLKALTEAVGMSVEEDNYPDNYFSDMDTTDEDYYTIMLAAEFGLLDQKAGLPARPDDMATREFVAFSLNMCLGYVLQGENIEYTFSDYEDTEYRDDIQALLNLELFELVDGKFEPELGITASEQTTLIDYAKSVIAEDEIDPDYEGTIEYKDGVKELENVTADVIAEDQLLLYGCEEDLAVGELFTLTAYQIPAVYKVLATEQTEDGLLVTVEAVAANEAFDKLDMEGTTAVDLTKIQSCDENTQIKYIVGGTAENNWEDGTKYDSLQAVGNQKVKAVEVIQIPDISDSTSIDLGDGMEAAFSFTISNTSAEFDYNIFEDRASLAISGDVEFGTSVSVNVQELLKSESASVDLVQIPVYGIGFIGLSLEMMIGGEITISSENSFLVGVDYKDGYMRLLHDFEKKSFTLQAAVSAGIGLKVSVGVGLSNIVKGYIYLEVGVTGEIATTMHAGESLTCVHLSAYLYVTIGAAVEISLLVVGFEGNLSYDVFSGDNSPVKVELHYENGRNVSPCTYDEQEEEPGDGSEVTEETHTYYTPSSSKYAYGGGGTGWDANGEEYTIFEYELNDANEATITKFNGNVSALSIPSQLDGYPVVGIANSVFKNNTLLRVVSIPDSVITIGNMAFAECSNLKTLRLSKGVTEIGYGAFKNCDALISVEIPKSLVSSPDDGYNQSDGVFHGCDRLEKVSFEEGTTRIASRLFMNCPGIKKIVIPDTVTQIGVYAFYSCENLEEVSIPNGVTLIQAEAFNKCKSLESVIIPDSVVEMEHGVFANCSKLSNVTLSKNLKEAGYGMFKDCDVLTSVEIPKSLESVSKDNTGEGYTGMFYGCDNLVNITFEEGTTRIASYLFANCPTITKMTIPSTVTEIGGYAFWNCTNLVEINIPDGVKVIKAEAFNGCTALESVIIPDSVTKMEHGVFVKCSMLSDVTLSANLSEAGYGLFKNCDALTTIEIPKSLQSVSTDYTSGSNGMFNGCDNLVNVSFEEGTTQIATRLFMDCPGLKEIVIPDTVETIGAYAFKNCSSLKDVKLGNAVTTIEKQAFMECPLIEEMVFPYKLKTINSKAFYDCSALTKVTIPRATESIADNAFSNPEGITVYGITGTYAQTYADEMGMTFVGKETPVEEIVFGATELQLEKGEKRFIQYTVTPQDFTDELTWSCSDESIVSVSQTGEVVANAIGKAVVTLTATSGKSASCSVRVISSEKRTVTFETLCDIVIEPVTIPLGMEVSEPTVNMEREGYTFGGWYLNGVKYNFAKAVTENIVLVARWDKVEEPVQEEPEGVLPEDIPESGEIPEGLWMSEVGSQVYTGSAIRPEVRVYYANTRLVEKEDYSIVYKNNVNVNDAGVMRKAPTITITGIGNYDGKVTQIYAIEPRNIEDVAVEDIVVAANNRVQKKVPNLVYNGKKLAKGRDFTVTYPDLTNDSAAYKAPGTYTIEVHGQKNYTGTKKISITIANETLVSKLKVAKIQSQTYTGEAIEPEITIKDGTKTLIKDTDYTVEYQNNTEIGTATILVEGVKEAGYIGKRKITFQIKPIASMKTANVVFSDRTFEPSYTGEAVSREDYVLTIKVKENGETITKELVEGIHYSVTYQKNVNAGRASIVFTGINGYTGTLKKSFRIKPYDLAANTDKLLYIYMDEAYNYQKGGTKPKPTVVFNGETLKEGKDYTLSYTENTAVNDGSKPNRMPAVVIKGKGNFSKTIKKSFCIGKADIGVLTLSTTDVVWKNRVNAYKTTIKIMDVNGKKLSPNRDYNGKLEYFYAEDTILTDGTEKAKDTSIGSQDILPVGTIVKVVVKARDNSNYTGEISGTYRIVKTDINKAKITIPTQYYTGSEITVEDAIVIRYKGAEVSTEDYEIVSYENNINKGKATVVIKGINNYGGIRKVTFTIRKKGF